MYRIITISVFNYFPAIKNLIGNLKRQWRERMEHVADV